MTRCTLNLCSVLLAQQANDSIWGNQTQKTKAPTLSQINFMSDHLFVRIHGAVRVRAYSGEQAQKCDDACKRDATHRTTKIEPSGIPSDTSFAPWPPLQLVRVHHLHAQSIYIFRNDHRDLCVSK